MVSEQAKVAVFGAGMIGIYVGGLLARDADVALIGRPSMLDALADGVRLTDVDGLDETISGFTRTADPAALAGADLVLVTVKSMQTADAAAAIAAHAPPGALIISLQNGVSNPDVLRAALPGRTVLAGMVPFNVAQRGPAHFHRGTGGGLVVEDSPALAPFEPLIGRSFPLTKSSNIVGVQWGKLLVNLNNAVNALSGVSLAEQLRQRDYRRSWALSVAEGLKLVEAAGITPVDAIAMPLKLMPQIMSLPDALYGYVMAAAGGGKVRVDPHARSSMADDLARGRPTEVDYLQGEVVRLAQRLGRKAPVSARMVQLVKAAEQGAPPIPAKALYAELKAAKRG
ncbi:2-dehydropantoate 2-reductase [Sandaracinobacter neustonicus]|uniref:2-dehydropantoate 2-reductase n=1 Tax=Sandaracinobacter neustonicus TaxID=1715348 RepID=A0A501XER6_9SPHN|nr:2-dehydropantoate 2-reductase [Sandaracinobacter neustonicus]TPE59025.1 2-dehydropantoate 2-reductase [Sandaracinobacter neustonicus]